MKRNKENNTLRFSWLLLWVVFLFWCTDVKSARVDVGFGAEQLYTTADHNFLFSFLSIWWKLTSMCDNDYFYIRVSSWKFIYSRRHCRRTHQKKEAKRNPFHISPQAHVLFFIFLFKSYTIHTYPAERFSLTSKSHRNMFGSHSICLIFSSRIHFPSTPHRKFSHLFLVIWISLFWHIPISKTPKCTHIYLTE